MMAEPQPTRYRNWVKGGLGLLYAKQGIKDFVSDEINTFQATILNNLGGSRCNKACTIQNVLRCPTPGMCGGRPCRFHDNTDPTKTYTRCSVCEAINNELVNAHRYGRPSYRNTTHQQWCTNSWELAKCFMPQPGYSDKNTAHETDFSGLINVVLNHKGFQKTITENLGQQGNTFEKARQVRNDIFHDGNNELSTPELNNYLDTLMDVLQDPKNLQQLLDAQSTLSKLQELKNDLITITTEDEVKVRQESIKELKLITVEKKEEIEHLTDEKKEEIEHITDKNKEEIEHITGEKKEEIEKMTRERERDIHKKVNDANLQLDEKTKELNEQVTKGKKVLDMKRKGMTLNLARSAKYRKKLDTKAKEMEKSLDEKTKEGTEILDRKTAEGEQRLTGALRSVKEDMHKEVKEVTNTLSNITEDKKASLEEFSQNLKTDIIYSRQSENYETRKHKLQKEILDHYNTSGCTKVAMPALIKGKLTDIEDIFVMPSMKVVGTDQPADKGKIVSTIHELFRTDNQPIRKVCVTGDAGHGKTTLCKSIVSNWCKIHTGQQTQLIPDTDRQFLSNFQFLFCIQLRNHQTSDVIDMIKSELVRKPFHTTLREVLEKESHTCLIVLDGLDEWQSSGASNCNVPYLDPKEKFTVLITSRAWKIEVLRPTEPEIGRDVSLCEVNKYSLVRAIVKVLNSRTGKWKSWHDFFLYKGCVKAEQLLEVPIVLSQMICMWFDNEKFGETRLEIYGKMIDYLFQVYERRQKSEHHSTRLEPIESSKSQLSVFFSELPFCRKYSNILLKLSEVAYETLFNCEKESSLVFAHSKKDLYQLTEDEVDLCLTVGILSNNIYSGKVASEAKTFSFLHKTYQEYLAAIFLAYGGAGRTVSAMMQPLQTLKDVFEMSEVIIFLSGMRPDMIADTSRHIAEIVDANQSILRDRARNSEIKHVALREVATDRVQSLICNCIAAIPEGKNLDSKLELHDLFVGDDPDDDIDDNIDAVISYLNIETVKSISSDSSGEIRMKKVLLTDYEPKHLTQLTLSEITLTHFYIELLLSFLSRATQLHLIKLYRIICTSCVQGHSHNVIDLSHHHQLHCLKLETEEGDITMYNKVHYDKVIESDYPYFGSFCVDIVLSNETPMTHCRITGIKRSHSSIDMLSRAVSQCTHLERIDVEGIKCTTCVPGQCNYRIDLSNLTQLQTLCMEELYGCEQIILNNKIPLTYCLLNLIVCSHSFIEDLGMSLSQCTQLETIILSDITCTTCSKGQCNDRIDLAHHKQLQYLHLKRLSYGDPVFSCHLERIECSHSGIEILGQCNYRIDLSNHTQLHTLHMEKLYVCGQIILNNKIPLTHCHLESIKCSHSIIEVLGLSLSQWTQLQSIVLNDIKCTTCVQGQCNYRIDLSHHKQLQDLRLKELGGHIILSNEVPLTSCHLERIECSHSGIEVLEMSLSQWTQLQRIVLNYIKCTTCVQGQCNYRIDLSHHKQLQDLRLEELGGHIILSNEVPLTSCHLERIECSHSGIEVLGMSLSQCTQLQRIVLNYIKCTTCVQGQCNYRIDLSRHNQLEDLRLEELGGHIILSNEVPLTSCHLERIECSHSGIEVLGMSLSQCTQLRRIVLNYIKCTTCVQGQCNYRIYLSRHNQLVECKLGRLNGDVALSNNSCLRICSFKNMGFAEAIIDRLKSSTTVYSFILVGDECLSNINSTISTTTTVHNVGEVQPSQLSFVGDECLFNTYSTISTTTTVHNVGEVQRSQLSFVGDECLSNTNSTTSTTTTVHNVGEVQPSQLSFVGDESLSDSNSTTSTTTTVYTVGEAQPSTLSVVGDESLSNTNSTTSTTTTVHNVGEVQPSTLSFVGDESLSNTNSTTSTTTTVHNVGEVQPSTLSCVGDECLSNTNSAISTTTTVHTLGEVQPSTLSLSKVLTDIIPTFNKLNKLSLSNVDFKQDILRVSPELTHLREVNLKNISMTLQCFQGFIDSLSQIQQYTEYKINVENVSICPKEDLLSALQCITDSNTIRCMTDNVCTRDGVIKSMVLQGISSIHESNWMFLIRDFYSDSDSWN